MRKILIVAIMSTLLLGFASSCAWMGRMAGKTVATGENIADSISEKAGEKQERMKEGYEQGYEETKKD